MPVRTVLIADDEVHLTRIVALGLAKAGAAVVVARNGSELVEQAFAARPDLIVTDYQMPVLDGFEACCRLKADPRTADVPIVMLTARGHRLAPADLARTNIRLLLPKPFSIRELLAAVDRFAPAVPSAMTPATTPPTTPATTPATTAAAA